PAPVNRGGHEQNEQRAHPVVAEALPHFGEEESRQAARVAEEALVLLGGTFAGREILDRRDTHGAPFRNFMITDRTKFAGVLFRVPCSREGLEMCRIVSKCVEGPPTGLFDGSSREVFPASFDFQQERPIWLCFAFLLWGLA